MRSFKTVEISCRDNLFISFLYNTAAGRLFLRLLVTATVSKTAGLFMNSRISKVLIKSFIRRRNIDMSRYEDVGYSSFNDFFTRQVKPECRNFPDAANDLATDDLAAACDGKLTAYTITSKSVFTIKGCLYDIGELLADKALADEFKGGVCLVFRLTPDDYHRYSFIDDGEIESYKKINGVLHTVRPIASKRYDIYVQNYRECTVMNTKRFGKLVQIEVGALFVGRIRNLRRQQKDVFKCGQEKGMFEFGGSTIVMLFQKGAVAIDDAIYENTDQNKETVVKMGDIIGEKFSGQTERKFE
ncbi:MAG: phosphatidylserine decarboxylase [Chitinispirillales bacterium]|jgi:phosphatidylserine decarboxylase|nr:phosphatidylserine decarboxylase [Chitinispirillales bacterium]